MNFIPYVQIILEHQEVRQGNSEIIKFHLVEKMLFGVIGQLMEAAFGLLLISQLTPGQALIENHIRRLVVVIHRAGRLLQSPGSNAEAFLSQFSLF
ncbi:hypothetical protein D3C74_409970 [compost metagenome]